MAQVKECRPTLARLNDRLEGLRYVRGDVHLAAQYLLAKELIEADCLSSGPRVVLFGRLLRKGALPAAQA
jgi:hypothetical protein